MFSVSYQKYSKSGAGRGGDAETWRRGDAESATCEKTAAQNKVMATKKTEHLSLGVS
jgi:hypothetical protein